MKQRMRFTFCRNRECRKLTPRGNYCYECARKRRQEKRERRKNRRSDAEYPRGFKRAADRESLVCAVCGSGQYVDRHHILCARIAQTFGDPHAETNLAPLCGNCHPKFRAADEALMRNDWLEWKRISIAVGLPAEILSKALAGYGIDGRRIGL